MFEDAYDLFLTMTGYSFPELHRAQLLLAIGMGVPLALMLIAERVRPAREFPVYRNWIWIGMGVTVVFVALANTWALIVPKDWLRAHRLFNGESLGIAAGIPLWYICSTFVNYWYHRMQHRFSVAWRVLHQVHHGVPRVDIPSALMAHPSDVILSTTVGICMTTFVLGLNSAAVQVAGVVQFFITLVPHWNVRTPRWLGYVVQRPEEHILHHERGVHAGNYADWPLWDKLFGTYRAPEERPIEVGYERAGLMDQLRMLAFVDVNAGVRVFSR
jgi:sterol desaturase/sphingolipid hydroxylase (fatty acid hydroxylase superfamily)